MMGLELVWHEPTVEVWRGLASGPVDLETLSTAERLRAEAFRTMTWARRYVLRRTALRALLGERLGVDPVAVEIVLSDGGKPILANGGLHFSCASRDGHFLISLSDAVPIGVDLERSKSPMASDLQVAEHFFTPKERGALARHQAEFTQIWTRKEAIVKALGIGLAGPLVELDSLSPNPAWKVDEIPLAGDWVAAVCTLKTWAGAL